MCISSIVIATSLHVHIASEFSQDNKYYVVPLRQTILSINTTFSGLINFYIYIHNYDSIHKDVDIRTRE